MSNAANSITSGLKLIWENPTKAVVEFLAMQLPPQSSFYIQLVMIGMTFGLGFECLRIFPLIQAGLRQLFGPHLTEKERDRIWMGLRPLSNPHPFFHARVLAQIVLNLMICFVYVVIAPVTSYVLSFCFLAMGSAYRNQFFYIYSTNPDSGGKLWLSFVNISLICMAVARITLGAYLALKKANIAAGLMVPLLVFQILFHIYIRQRHFQVAARLPTEDSVQLDAEGPTDFSFLKDKYVQAALKFKVLELDYPPNSENGSNGNDNSVEEGAEDAHVQSTTNTQQTEPIAEESPDGTTIDIKEPEYSS